MNLLDIFEADVGEGQKVQRSAVWINKGGLGLTTEQREFVIQEAMRAQHVRAMNRGMQVGNYRGNILVVGDYRYNEFSGQRCKVVLTSPEQSGELDFLLTAPTRVKCGTFAEKPEEVISQEDYRSLDYI